jgi:hypothetical protein
MTPAVAHDALAALAKRWTYRQVESSHLIAHKRSAGKGRPTPRTPLKAIAWQIQVRARPDQEALEQENKSAVFIKLLPDRSAQCRIRSVPSQQRGVSFVFPFYHTFTPRSTPLTAPFLPSERAETPPGQYQRRAGPIADPQMLSHVSRQDSATQVSPVHRAWGFL